MRGGKNESLTNGVKKNKNHPSTLLSFQSYISVESPADAVVRSIVGPTVVTQPENMLLTVLDADFVDRLGKTRGIFDYRGRKANEDPDAGAMDDTLKLYDARCYHLYHLPLSLPALAFLFTRPTFLAGTLGSLLVAWCSLSSSSSYLSAGAAGRRGVPRVPAAGTCRSGTSK